VDSTKVATSRLDAKTLLLMNPNNARSSSLEIEYETVYQAYSNQKSAQTLKRDRPSTAKLTTASNQTADYIFKALNQAEVRKDRQLENEYKQRCRWMMSRSKITDVKDQNDEADESTS